MTEEEKPLKAVRGKFPNKRYLNSENAREIVKKSGLSDKVGSCSDYDRIQVARDMLAWVKKDENINLCGFSADYEIPSCRILSWVKEDPVFRASYNLCRDYLGRKRELKLSSGELHTKAWDLNAMTYDGYLREQVRDQMTFEAGLKSDSKEEDDSSLNKKFDEFNGYLLGIQKGMDEVRLKAEKERLEAMEKKEE